MSSKSEIAALISLLDDEDEEILQHVSRKLISLGKPILPQLDDAWGSSVLTQTHYERIEDIIASINFDTIYSQLKSWKKENYKDVFEAGLIISQLFYPNIDTPSCYSHFDQIKKKIWLELNYSYTPLENINIFNQVFYKLLGFEGVQSNEASYGDYCINHVLESRKGSAIALGILYISLAQSLDLPVYGVNLYKNFILAYQKNFILDYTPYTKNDTVFYLSPLNSGASFFRKEIGQYLKSIAQPKLDIYFTPAAPTDIAIELLQYILAKVNEKETPQQLKLSQIGKLLELLSNDK